MLDIQVLRVAQPQIKIGKVLTSASEAARRACESVRCTLPSGQLTHVPALNWSAGFLEKKQKRFEDEKKQDDKLKKTLASELEWVRSNPKARQTKSKARLDRYEVD